MYKLFHIPLKSIPKIVGRDKGLILDKVPFLIFQSVGLTLVEYTSTTTSVDRSFPIGRRGRSQSCTFKFVAGP